MSRQTKLSRVHRDNFIKYNLSFIKFILKAPHIIYIYTHTHRLCRAPTPLNSSGEARCSLSAASSPWRALHLVHGCSSASPPFSHISKQTCGGLVVLHPPPWANWNSVRCQPSPLPQHPPPPPPRARPIPTSLFSLPKTICGQFSPQVPK